MSEDFYIDGDVKNMFVLTRENDSSVYFYYPGEITFPRIVKWVDIEPARVIKRKIQGRVYTLVLTRYHYWGLIVYINPGEKMLSGISKPVIVFEKNVHTPHLMKHGDLMSYAIEDAEKLSPVEDIEWAIAQIWKYINDATRRVNSSAPEAYPSAARETKREIINDPTQRFDDDAILTNSQQVFLVGSKQESECILSALIDPFVGITRASLCNFLTTGDATGLG